jgi:hypothetical protein
VSSWPEALDTLEEQVRRHRAYLDGRGPLPDAVAADLPGEPFPEELRLRATLVLAEIDDLAAEVDRLRPVVPASPYR